MLKNYLLVAFRNISKNSIFSGVNIAGLAIGMAACLLILQYVTFELSYDTFNVYSARLYRINQDRYTIGKLSTQWAAGASAAGPAFKSALPEIEDYAKLLNREQQLINDKDKHLVIRNDYFVSNSFFKLFSYPLLQGDRAAVLKEPNTVVLSATTAKKLFDQENPVGKTILVGKRAVKVSGIIQDMPTNSHLKLEFMEAYATLNVIEPPTPTWDREKQWFSDGYITYLLLKPGVDVKALESKFAPIASQGMADIPNESVTYSVQLVKDIHLYSNRMMEAESNGDGKAVYLLLGIAIFVIVIAWINYINLATARGMARAKEVGVRKTLGSGKWQLIFQFLLEAMVLNGLAIVLAGCIIALLIPAFATLTGMPMGLNLFIESKFWILCFLLFLAGSVLSGFYPAIILSAYRPVDVLKGKISNSQKGVVLRKSMVVFQFAASIFLLISSLTVYRQVAFMQQQKLGVSIEQTLVIQSPLVQVDSLNRDMQAFELENLSQSAIMSIAISTDVPGSAIGWNMGRLRLKGETEDKGVQARIPADNFLPNT